MRTAHDVRARHVPTHAHDASTNDETTSRHVAPHDANTRIRRATRNQEPRLIEESIGRHELGIQDRRTGGAADGVVAERDELRVRRLAGAYAADGDRHAVAAVGVEPRLRAIGFARRR